MLDQLTQALNGTTSTSSASSTGLATSSVAPAPLPLSSSASPLSQALSELGSLLGHHHRHHGGPPPTDSASTTTASASSPSPTSGVTASVGVDTTAYSPLTPERHGRRNLRPSRSGPADERRITVHSIRVQRHGPTLVSRIGA
jgi:hypothetical protein